MHFVTGGAFNGKRAWVKKVYKDAVWVSAYENGLLPAELAITTNLLVLEGIEIWIRELTKQHDDANQCREIWNCCLNGWHRWEKADPNRLVVVIGTDITKGIVPMEKENRLWRDVTGWAYQDLAAKAEKVDFIWYGINQTIKSGGDC
ncbi:bifunctional adenosylcobinamide kinase/adenosylcobinamide-phosphate guanylyltransferase [Neobacillus kokaensis]|uniref:Adenosylcobinamide kinase n=1 Tax=Neobacillus kokaensis TaxID=2759023 RepID=A0ABQ3MX61_9BACI|nr:bifunctional adenosylcobinamide kinase/adenosylcobinamide-phosphate guanylyltransferase [Neobacillus kokaensis]GHH96834.1 hypothetical protein AM1BK_03770 [Neobacillus kokaensis]